MHCVSCDVPLRAPWPPTKMCRQCHGAPDHAPCPKCGGAVADWDGFGVLHHAPCGYCKHASVMDGVCGFCGKAVSP